MTPESITGLSISRELVRDLFRGEEPVSDTRRLRVLAALADIERRREEQSAGHDLGEAA